MTVLRTQGIPLWQRFKYALGTIILIASVFLVAQCGSRDSNSTDQLPQSKSIAVQFLYLPDSQTTLVTITNDSILVKRVDTPGKDSVFFGANRSDSAAILADSVAKLLAQIPAGTYTKKNVIDGTIITVSSDKYRVVCENCLNDYIMEKVGIALPRQPKPVRYFRAFTVMVNELVLFVEPADSTRLKNLERLQSLQHLYQERYNREIQFLSDSALPQTFGRTHQ